MFRFDKYSFYHIPKTGGKYVLYCINKIAKTRPHKGIHSNPLYNKKHKYNHSMCVFRDPLDWYKSYFRYRIKNGWKIKKTNTYDGFHVLDIHCKAGTFEKFIENVIVYNINGYVTDLYLRYLPFCKHILQQKNLETELKNLLENFGYNPKIVKKRINETDKSINTDISSELKEKITCIESQIIRYYTKRRKVTYD